MTESATGKPGSFRHEYNNTTQQVFALFVALSFDAVALSGVKVADQTLRNQ
jgi:hypothetical protein